jgi:nucleoside-diphosphate-sugar epimerase
VNVGGTLELLRAMEATAVDRLVFASTAAIYGTPEQQPMAEDLPDAPPHPYASSKAAAEAVLGWEAPARPGGGGAPAVQRGWPERSGPDAPRPSGPRRGGG